MTLKNIFGLPAEISNLKEGNNIELEKIKLTIEWYKTWGAIISIAIPLFTGAAAVISGVWLASNKAETEFLVKVTEIVMNAETPSAARNKAIVISELFPNRVPKDFKEKMQRLYPNN